MTQWGRAGWRARARAECAGEEFCLSSVLRDHLSNVIFGPDTRRRTVLALGARLGASPVREPRAAAIRARRTGRHMRGEHREG